MKGQNVSSNVSDNQNFQSIKETSVFHRHLTHSIYIKKSEMNRQCCRKHQSEVRFHPLEGLEDLYHL